MGKRKNLLKNAERIVCSECSESNKQLFHINGTYICKDCLEKQGKEDSPEMKARKDVIRQAFYNATFGTDSNEE